MSGCPGDDRNGGGGCSPEILIVEDDRQQTKSQMRVKSVAHGLVNPRRQICYIVHNNYNSISEDITVYSIFFFLPEAAAERVPSHSAVVGSDALYNISPFARKKKQKKWLSFTA